MRAMTAFSRARRRGVSFLCASVGLLLTTPLRLPAQATNGQITGRITDPSAAVVAGVAVSVVNVDTGFKQEGQSTDDGYYTVTALPPGAYRLEVRKDGFRPVSRTGLRLETSETLRVDFTLEIGSVTEVMEISAAPPLVETASGARTQVVSQRSIEQLPLNGRNVYDLVRTVPGSATDNSGRTRVNGIRARANEYQVDGVTQVSADTRGGTMPPPPPDSLQEFNVLSSTFSAEYGNTSGALVNAATKSGTNALHATFWEFLRNDKLNTRNFFTPASSAKPVLRQNQFGVAGGGPVWLPGYNGRNRTFFFADYDGYRQRGQSVFNTTVPTSAFRSGDFSALLGPVIGADALGRNVRQGQIYDPFTRRTLASGEVVSDPVPNNVFTSSQLARLDPASQKVLALFPNPTLPGAIAQNFVTPSGNGSDYDRFDVRLDHALSDRHRLFAKYSRYTQTGLASAAFRDAGLDAPTDVVDENITGVANSTLSPTLVNEARFSVLLINSNRIPYGN